MLTESAARPAQGLRDAPGRARAPVVLLFFFSGAAGLVYEVLWNRMLALEMGNTAHSLATILTVFMGGLALGSWLGGRAAARVRNAVLAYGLLEIAIGAWCLLVPFLIGALRPVTAWLYREHYGSLAVFNLAQFLLCGAVLLVPVTLMGATLPIVAEHATRSAERIARSVGWVYAVNTAGAFAGCMVAGLYLVPELGLTAASHVAVGLNCGVGVLAVLLARRSGAGPSSGAPSAAAADAPRPSASALPVPLLLVGFGLSGFAAMTYQVAWTRIFTLSIGSATYAFTLIVGAFILGLALGAAAIGRLGESPRALAPLLWLSQLGLALAAAAILPALGELPARVARDLFEHKESFAGVQRAEFLAIFALVLAPTFLMGGALPLVCKAVALASGADVGAVLGRAYASNTIGTILGSFAAGFLLVPSIGMRGAILCAIGINALVGAAWLAASLRRGLPVRLLAALLAAGAPAALALAMPRWDRTLMTSAPYIDGAAIVELTDGTAEGYKRYTAGRYQLLHYAEDVATTVTITLDRNTGEAELRVGGKVDARKYHASQAYLAHLPLVLHQDPASVLIVGLGSGGTLESALCHGAVRSVDSVEISGAVIDASRRFFDRHAAFDDPRVRMIVGDGRLHVAMTDRRYDVIISQPSNPWIVGASALFTRECFEEMKARLAPGGIACVWMQGFQVGPDAVRTLVATFASVFEHMDLWEGRSREEYFLTGYLEPRSIDVRAIAERLQEPRVRTDLARMYVVQPVDFLGYFVADRAALEPWIAGERVSTDDHNLLEASIPRGLLRGSSLAVAEELMKVRQPLLERVAFRSDEPGADEFAVAADAMWRSKPLALEAFRAQKTSGRIPPELVQRIAKLNPFDEYAVPLLYRKPPGMD